MLMLGCKGITSSPASLSPPATNMTDLLGTECYGLWENENLSSGKLDSSDIMELIDSNNTSTTHSTLILTSASPCSSSSASSSPSSIIHSDPCGHGNSNSDILTPVSLAGGEHYSQSHHGHGHGMMMSECQQHADNQNQTQYSSFITPLPMHGLLQMNNGGQSPYSPTEVQMLESFSCMDGTDFHKLNDSFADSYNFLSEEPHHQLQSMSGVHLNNHHQHQALESGQHEGSNHQHALVPQSTNHSSTTHILTTNPPFQFSEPSHILPHGPHHSQHQTITPNSTFQQYRGHHEYNNNSWEESSYYGGDFRFNCKGESPAASDSVSYTSVDSGVGSSKSSTDSISTTAYVDNHNKLMPPKRRVGRPPKKDKKQKKLEKKTGRLWEFIRDLLKNPEYCPSLVRWENPEEGHFRFVNSDQVAKLWGRLKGNPRMTYEKLSRAMRYYYKSKVFEPVLGRRLVYKFGYNATNWRPTNPNFSQKMFC